MEYTLVMKKKYKGKISRRFTNWFGKDAKINKIRREKIKMLLDKSKEFQKKINDKIEEKDRTLKELEEQKKQADSQKVKIGLVGILTMVLGAVALSFLFILLLNISDVRENVRDSVMDALIGNERRVMEQEIRAEYEAKLAKLVAENVAVDNANIEKEYANIDNLKEELRLREESLVAKEAEIKKLKDETDVALLSAKTLEKQLQGKVDEIIELSDIYEEMEPKSAVVILSNLDDKQLVMGIVKNMKKENAAEILALMKPEEAADIISEMSD